MLEALKVLLESHFSMIVLPRSHGRASDEDMRFVPEDMRIPPGAARRDVISAIISTGGLVYPGVNRIHRHRLAKASIDIQIESRVLAPPAGRWRH